MDTAKTSEPGPDSDEPEAAQPPPGDMPATDEDEATRRSPGPGLWAAIAVGVVALVVAAAVIGYYVGRGDDSGASEAGGTSDTKRTDQELCTELLGALNEVAATPNPADASVLAASMRSHVAGLLSDAPASATTASVQDAYDAASELAAGDPAASPALRSAYEEKLAIAQYQCDKIATWDWPAI